MEIPFWEKVGQRSIEIFSEPSHPASFSHPEKILKYLRLEPGFEDAKLKHVRSALSALPAYSRFQRLKTREFPRMTTRADDVDERYQVDLMNVESFDPSKNDNTRFLLIVIDVFSRSIIVSPLKNKTGAETSDAMEMILMTTGRYPKSIASDSGREFSGRAFRSLCRKYGIQQFFTVPEETHASVVERVILTLRQKIGKFLSLNKTTRFMDALGEIVSTYNDSLHSTVGMAPRDAAGSLANRQLALFSLRKRLNLQQQRNQRHTSRKPKPGDRVRIPLPYQRFRKAHEPGYSENIFVVDRAFRNDKKRLTTRLRATRDTDPQQQQRAQRRVFYSSELPIVEAGTQE